MGEGRRRKPPLARPSSCVPPCPRSCGSCSLPAPQLPRRWPSTLPPEHTHTGGGTGLRSLAAPAGSRAPAEREGQAHSSLMTGHSQRLHFHLGGFGGWFHPPGPVFSTVTWGTRSPARVTLERDTQDARSLLLSTRPCLSPARGPGPGAGGTGTESSWAGPRDGWTGGPAGPGAGRGCRMGRGPRGTAGSLGGARGAPPLGKGAGSHSQRLLRPVPAARPSTWGAQGGSGALGSRCRGRGREPGPQTRRVGAPVPEEAAAGAFAQGVCACPLSHPWPEGLASRRSLLPLRDGERCAQLGAHGWAGRSGGHRGAQVGGRRLRPGLLVGQGVGLLTFPMGQSEAFVRCPQPGPGLGFGEKPGLD